MEKNVRVQTVYDDKYEMQAVLQEILDERVTLVVGGKRADARTRCKLADMVEQGIDVSLRFFVSRSRENSIHCITAVIKEQKQKPAERVEQPRATAEEDEQFEKEFDKVIADAVVANEEVI